MKFADFLADEGGAVAVDWVVLTAGVVGMGMATTMVVSGGMENLSNDTGQALSNIEVGFSFGEAAPAQSGWGINPMLNDNGWTAEQLAATARSLDTEGLQHDYGFAYLIANSPDHPNQDLYIDYVGALEAEMQNRGLSRPEDNLSYDQLYAAYTNG